jgi:hypothetical protein
LRLLSSNPWHPVKVSIIADDLGETTLLHRGKRERILEIKLGIEVVELQGAEDNTLARDSQSTLSQIIGDRSVHSGLARS